MAAAEYEIVIHGRLGPALVRSFEEFEIRSTGPEETQLRGWLPDQSALQGLLHRLGDLGIELSAVRRVTDPD